MSDWLDRPARQLTEALRTGRVASETVTSELLARIDARNPPINAVIYLDRERALDQARERDRQREHNTPCGALHGLPMTVKDVWEVAGMPTTAGSSSLSTHHPKRHADAIQRLENAGAIIIGKTNVPLFASDLQTYNRLFGVTNNPRDLSLTPGGSSGGAAAALAAGMTPLEIGSDVGGSIRTPAHFNGVFGHKPSRDIVSLRGHIPGPPGTLSQPDLAEGGPMARTADDLALLLDVIAGPRPHEGPQWTLSLPEPGFSCLGDVRVATCFHDALSPVADALTRHYEDLATRLADAGTSVSRAENEWLDHRRLMPLYHNLLGSLLGTGFRPKQRRQLKLMGYLVRLFSRWMRIPPGLEQYIIGVNQPVLNWLQYSEQREQARAALVNTLFGDADVLLTPVTPTTAIPHNRSQPMFRRKILVDGRERPYTDQMHWIALATVLGLPATSAPVGLDENGLPFNVQIIGAPGQDRATIEFARLLEAEGLSGFDPL
ncbi:amidase family protein [Salicola sp. Rm-C-2C1-2]|uniref:amidase family protein n=1 Tax=Salicola sp. Rm-C-2C1-2 TaxID=3141321 RepID=UPI0032E3740B